MGAYSVAAACFGHGEELQRRWLGACVVYEGHSGHANRVMRREGLAVRVWEGVRSEAIAGRVGAVRDGLVLIVLQRLVMMCWESRCGAVVIILLLRAHQRCCVRC